LIVLIGIVAYIVHFLDMLSHGRFSFDTERYGGKDKLEFDLGFYQGVEA
jgi:hypothetical protein